MAKYQNKTPAGLPAEKSGHQTLEVLQQKLMSAEEDTKYLVDQLSQMGLEPDVEGATSGLHHSTILPFKLHGVDNEAMHKNYEVLISRLCKTESAIQTLKLNLLRVQGERDLILKEKVAVKEKFSTSAEAYDTEIRRVNRELTQAKKEAKENLEARNEAEDNIRRLQHALQESSSTRSETSVEIDELRTSKQKLQRKFAEAKEEVAREASLRTSLEEAQQTLLARVAEMEQIVEYEREQVKRMTENSLALKKDVSRSRNDSQQDKKQHEILEKKLQKMQDLSFQQTTKIKSLEEDKKLLMTEMNKMRKQYQDLNNHLDQMKNMVEDKQGNQKKLQQHNHQLQEAMKSAAEHNAELITNYEEELQIGRAEIVAKTREEQTLNSIEQKLQKETRDRVQAEQKCSDQEQQIVKLREKLGSRERELTRNMNHMEKEANTMKEQMESLQREKEQALKDKESLLDEVNQAVDSMAEERVRLQAEIDEAKLEAETAKSGGQQLHQEHSRLLQRIGTLEDQQSSNKQVEQTLQDMMQQKQQLSYDKGKLQSQVQQLQEQLQTQAGQQAQLQQLRRTMESVEAKYTKSHSDLTSSQMAVQHLEAQLKQSKIEGTRRDEDFQMALSARDELNRENKKMRELIEKIEKRERQQVVSLNQNIAECREDGKKMGGTLESIMNSHNQLQLTIEGLQLELGRKDAEIEATKTARHELQHQVRQQAKELDTAHSKVSSIETYQTSELTPLRKALKKSKEDNYKLATTMETLLHSSSQLHSSVGQLQDEIEQKACLLEKLQKAREQDQDMQKQEIQSYEERMTNLRQQLSKERDRSYKKTNKEVAEVRKQLDELVSKNGDLSRANTELRHQTTELEMQIKEMHDKMSGSKAHIEHLGKIRKKQEMTLDKMQGMNVQIAELEKAKNDYVKKNKDQAKTIETFMSQISSLENEVRHLAQTHLDQTELIQQQEEDLERERRHRDAWRSKYKISHSREQELENVHRNTTMRLQEVNNESLQESFAPPDAQIWFKSKLGDLQDELNRSKKSHEILEKENYETKTLLEEEKSRAEETAARAQAMIKASRETISRLADYADASEKRTTSQMRDMKQQLLEEKQAALLTEEKFRNFQKSSLRQTEELAREVETMKSHSHLYDSNYC